MYTYLCAYKYFSKGMFMYFSVYQYDILNCLKRYRDNSIHNPIFNYINFSQMLPGSTAMVLEWKAAWLGNSAWSFPQSCNPSKGSWAKDDLQLQALEGHPTQIMLDKMSTVAHAVILRDLREDRLLLVANTHLQLGITNSSDSEETQPQQWSSFTMLHASKLIEVLSSQRQSHTPLAALQPAKGCSSSRERCEVARPALDN